MNERHQAPTEPGEDTAEMADTNRHPRTAQAVPSPEPGGGPRSRSDSALPTEPPAEATDPIAESMADTLDDDRGSQVAAEVARGLAAADDLATTAPVIALRRAIGHDETDVAAAPASAARPDGPPATVGPYPIVRQIGVGGMAVIYEAKHPTLRRPVAIKVLHERHRLTPSVTTSFLAESLAASRLSHPGIVMIHDHGYADSGSAYLVMELLAGVSLAGHLSGKPLDLGRALRIGLQTADALAAAHEVGIVHRDVKPENIHLVPVGDGEQVKLLDFGVAKVLPELTNTSSTRDAFSGASRATRGLVLGTLAYMAPEQLLDPEHVDGRADVFSLGCVLYQLVCGSPPWNVKTTTIESVSDPRRRRPRRPADRRPGLPREVDRLIMQMLEHDPGKRPQTMAEVRGRLAEMARPLAAEEEEFITQTVQPLPPPRQPRAPAPAAAPATRRGMRTVVVVGVAVAIFQLLLARWLGLL